MKFGISVAMRGTGLGEPGPALLRRVAAWGFDGVELHVPPDADGDALRRMRADLAACGLEATVSCDEPSGEPLFRHLYRLVDACAVLDARILCESSPAHDDDEGVAALRSAAAYAARFGVTLALTCRDREADGDATTIAQTLRVADLVGAPNVGLLYDTLHAHVEEPSVSGAILSAGPRIRHVRIVENDGGVPGSGQVRWAETFAALDAIGYDGWYVVETKPDVPLDALASAGVQFLRRHRMPAA